MRRTLIVVFILLMCPSIVSADAESHKKAAEEVLVMTNAQERLNISIRQVKEAYLRVLVSSADDEGSIEEAKRLAKTMGDYIEKEMSWEKMKDKYITIYVDVFSEQDINELIAFYKTPIGKKFIEKMPIISERSLEVSQSIATNLIKELKGNGFGETKPKAKRKK